MKHWITFNEPHGLSIQGYDTGLQAPGRCSILGHIFCKRGQSSIEPYLVTHNILQAHATVYHKYRLHFKVTYVAHSISFYSRERWVFILYFICFDGLGQTAR